MAIPKGAGNVGKEAAAKAKELAVRVSEPVRRRVDDVRQQVGTKEGLKNIAFTAGGRDPIVGIATGVGLAVGAATAGLGIKGIAGVFKGIRGLIGEAKEEPIQDDIIGDESFADMSSETNEILKEILRVNKEHLNITDGMMTMAARKRVEDRVAQSQRIEVEKEAARKKSIVDDALSDLSNFLTAGSVFGQANDNDKVSLFERLAQNRAAQAIAGALGLKKIFGGGKRVKPGKAIKGAKIATAALTASVAQSLGKEAPKPQSKLAKGAAKVGQGAKTVFRGFPGIAAALAVFDGLSAASDELEKNDDFSRASFAGLAGIVEGLAFLPNLALKMISFGQLGFNEEDMKKFRDRFIKLGEAIGGAGGAAVNLFGTRVKDIKDSFGDMIQSLKDNGPAIIENFKKSVMKWWDNLLEITRMAIVGMIQKVPLVGKSIAKTFMTPQEKAEVERKQQSEEVGGRIADANIAIIDLKNRKTGFFFSDKDKQEQLKALNDQKKKDIDEFRNLQRFSKTPTVDTSADRQATTMNNIKSESVAQRAQRAAPIIISAPSISDNSQSQVTNNTMVGPFSVRNSDPSADRALSAQF